MPIPARHDAFALSRLKEHGFVALVWSKVHKVDSDSCWLWRDVNLLTGRAILYLSRVPRRQINASRLMFLLTHGAIGADVVVAHTCDNPKCVNPAHLFATDHVGNMRDMAAKGRSGGGRNIPVAVRDEVRGRFAAGGITVTQLSKEYGVHWVTVSCWINNRKKRVTWQAI